MNIPAGEAKKLEEIKKLMVGLGTPALFELNNAVVQQIRYNKERQAKLEALKYTTGQTVKVNRSIKGLGWMTAKVVTVNKKSLTVEFANGARAVVDYDFVKE